MATIHKYPTAVLGAYNTQPYTTQIPTGTTVDKPTGLQSPKVVSIAWPNRSGGVAKPKQATPSILSTLFG